MIYKLDSCKKVYYTSFLLSFTPGCGVLFPSKLKVQLWYSNMQLWLSNTQFWIWLSLELLTELWYSDIPLRHSKLNAIFGFFGVKPSRAGHHSPTWQSISHQNSNLFRRLVAWKHGGRQRRQDWNKKSLTTCDKYDHLGRVVRKPVNVNPGLNVNCSINFSCLKLFSISNIWCSLRLLQLKTAEQTI